MEKLGDPTVASQIPTENSLGKIKELMKIGRYLEARKVYYDIGRDSFGALSTDNQKLFVTLMERCASIDKYLVSNEGADWTFGAESNGITTNYRMESDGSVSVAIIGAYSVSV